MIIKQISVFVENKPGKLVQVTRAIGDAGVDIRALSIADTSDFGILRLIVNDPDKAVEALRAAEMTVSLTDVIAVGIEDKPGAFAKVVQLLSDEGVNIEYMYAFLGREQRHAFVIMRTENADEAVKVLRAKNIRLLSGEEIYNM